MINIVVFLGVAIANFGFQTFLVDVANYKIAFDRTFFQGAALFAVYVFQITER
jgi:hypothetical protein